MADHLDPIFAAIDDAIAADHERELRAFSACHDAEADEWVREIALLARVRDLLRQAPYAGALP